MCFCWMIRVPPRSTRTGSRCPYTVLFRAQQDGRNIGRPQYLKARMAMGVVDEFDLPLEGLQHIAGERDGKGLRLTPGEIEENVGNFGRAILEAVAGKLIGEVFPCRQVLRPPVRRTVRRGVAGSAAKIG